MDQHFDNAWKLLGRHELTLLASIFVSFFLVQSVFLGYGYRPDEQKAVFEFSNFIFGSKIEPFAEFIIRTLLFSLCSAVSFILFRYHYINRATLAVALVWPLVPFLFSKVYWEFFVFPFCLVRHDLKRSSEFGFICFLFLLFLATGEGNLIPLIAFRSLLLFSHLKMGAIIPASFLVVTFALSISISQGWTSRIPFISDPLARFQWIREHVNPEYSIFESVAVFLSSAHFFTQHYYMWYVDLFITLIICALLFNRIFYLKRNGYLSSLNLSYSTISFVVVFLSMTELTRGFQNARYYLFFLPLFSSFVFVKDVYILAGLGFLHVFIKSFEFFLVRS